MRSLVEAARVGHLATVARDDRPHVVPCCFVLSDDVIYTAVDGKPKSTNALQRIENLRSNPKASLLVDSYSEDWSQLWWVRLDGTARILEKDAEFDHALLKLTSKYAQYQDSRPPGPVIAIEVSFWRGWP